MFKIHFPQPSFWEYSLSISFVTEPIRKDELTAIDIVARDAAGPAGFCMDPGAANAGVFAGIIKIAAELEDHWMGKPDLPDTVLPELPVRELGDRLPDPAERNLAGPEDA